MPRPKKGEAKDSKEPQRERTDDELKNSPTFHRQFYNEAKKQAEDDEQRQFIEKSFKDSSTHDDFSLKLFEIEWFLEKYEDIFNSAKTSMKAIAAKKEEPTPKQPEPIQSKVEHDEMDPNVYGRNLAFNTKVEPGYYSSYAQPPAHGAIYNQMGQMAMNPMAQMKSAYPSAEQYSPYMAQQGYPHQGQQMSPQVPQHVPQDMSQQMPPQIVRQLSQQMSQQMPPQMPPQMSQQMPQQMSQQMPQQMPPHMQSQLQPAMPNMSQQMPPQPVQQHAPPQAQVPLQHQTSQPAMQTSARNAPEKEEKATIKEPLMTMEFETNPQLRKRLYDIVPLNHQVMLNLLNSKINKKATDGFFNGLHLAVIDYVRNLMDELRNICDMDTDAADMKNYMKAGGTSSHSMDGDPTKNFLMGGIDGTGESKGPRHNQYLVKFSALQEDQKQIEKLDDKEQKDLEDKYTMSKDDDEEKITKKIKKDVTEEDEIIKFLFRTKKDKNQDNENISKKIQDANMTLSKLTSRSYTQPTAPSLGDSGSQRETSGKGRKGGAGQKRITMKHLIYYLETNPQYKKTPLLHKAYLK